MENKNAKIFVSSIRNLSKKLKYYGDANIDKISLLKLIYKYACYSTTYEQLQRLDKMIANLQRTDDMICMEKQAHTTSSYIAPIGVVEIGAGGLNVAPTLSDTAINVGEEADTFLFSYSSLFSGYSDEDARRLSP